MTRIYITGLAVANFKIACVLLCAALVSGNPTKIRLATEAHALASKTYTELFDFAVANVGGFADYKYKNKKITRRRDARATYPEHKFEDGRATSDF